MLSISSPLTIIMNKFAALLGITMIVIAGAIIGQKFGLNLNLKGQVADPCGYCAYAPDPTGCGMACTATTSPTTTTPTPMPIPLGNGNTPAPTVMVPTPGMSTMPGTYSQPAGKVFSTSGKNHDQLANDCSACIVSCGDPSKNTAFSQCVSSCDPTYNLTSGPYPSTSCNLAALCMATTDPNFKTDTPVTVSGQGSPRTVIDPNSDPNNPKYIKIWIYPPKSQLIADLNQQCLEKHAVACGDINYCNNNGTSKYGAAYVTGSSYMGPNTGGGNTPYYNAVGKCYIPTDCVAL